MVIVITHQILSVPSLPITFCWLYEFRGGIHPIRTNFYLLTLSKRNYPFNLCLESTVSNRHSSQYKFTISVLDIASHRLLKPVHNGKDKEKKRFLFKLSIDNIGLHAINLDSVLNHKPIHLKPLLILKISLNLSFLIPIQN